jgi:glycosyltransferase involved in cell wall biosynthesis
MNRQTGYITGMNDQEAPLVSVIIPTYNRAEYVNDAIECILNQTYSNIEIIVVDDGSTDHTQETLKKYSNAKNFRYIYQENRGPAGARNSGLRTSEGEYIQFLDSDDLITPDKIQLQVDYMKEHPDCDIIYSDVRFFHGNDHEHLFNRHLEFFSDNIFENIIYKVFIVIHSALIRRRVIEKIGPFDEALKRGEDPDFWIRASLAGMKFDYHDKPLALYRIHDIQVSKSRIENRKTLIKIIQRYAQYSPYHVKRAIGTHQLFIAEMLIREGRKSEGRRYLLQALRSRQDKIYQCLGIIILSYFMDGPKAIRMVGIHTPDTLHI